MSNTITDQQQGSSFGFMRNRSIVNSNTTSENHSFNGSPFHYTNHASTNGRTAPTTANVAVKYKIYSSKQSSAFTVTLLVPMPVPDNSHLTNCSTQHENDASPFQKVSSAEGAPSFNDKGEPIQTYALRIPLPYLVNESSQEASDADIQKSSAWLDRNTLRSRIDEGGRAIGLDQQQIYHSVAAVEQTASKLPRWCPRSTQTVTVDIILTDKIVTLVATVLTSSFSPGRKHSIGHYEPGTGSPSQRYYHHSNSNGIIGSSSQQSQPSPNSNRSSFNVFNETSGELVATAPSFPPPPGMQSSSVPRSLSSSNHNSNVDGHRSNSMDGGGHRGIYNDGNSFSAFSPPSKNRNDELNGNGNRNNVFNSPLLSSSFGSWGTYPSNHNNNTVVDPKQSQPQQQHQQQQHLNFSNLGPSSLPEPKANERNIFRMSSEPIHSSGGFLGQALNGNDNVSNPFTYQFDKDIFRNSSEITNGVRNESMNGNHNQISNASANNKARPDPSMIMGPLLKMGFNKEECEAAANAIRNISLSRSVGESDSPLQSDAEKDNQQHYSQMNGSSYSTKMEQKQADGQLDSSNDQSKGYNEVSTAMNNLSILGGNDNAEKDNKSSPPVNEILPKSTSNSVWGNAGKLKTIKNPSSDNVERSVTKMNEGSIDPDASSSGTRRDDYSSEDGSTQKQSQQQKMVKVLDIPPDLNAFIFHCNAQTRDECLERGLFGCPSGGQYGPHSKAKKGDLLFLADFSAWTVTGVFTANCDAGLNLEKSAWGGRFPWQIRVNEWNDLRTVHIDKINEIIGLASGSKLNMLTKDQLTQLVSSKEFGPCVPWLFKIKAQEA